MDAPVREVFHTPPGMSAPIEPLLLYQASQDEKCRHWVDSVYNRMNLREKVGQLFIYTIAPVQTKRNMQLLRDAVHTYKVGGLLFSGGKIQNQATLTNEAQRMARCPLLITFDGEWGLSMRLRGTPVFPRNMVLGCIQDNRLIYEYGREMARQCREMGVQVNFAPVADVNINPDNPVINTRSFGEDPVKVADKVIAYASGLESGKVLSVCKHFPGHGDTDVDSHKALPVLPFTRERLDSVELYPFKEAIRAGVSGMMVGHLQVPVIEPIGDLPSSLSRNVVYGLLTEELAFKGLFEEANNGTIFLDEIGEMAFELQAKLLRILETGEYIKIGDTKPTHIDVRIIAATNRNLPAEIAAGRFREDLFYRLSVFQVHLPPLRERTGDIKILAESFVRSFSEKLSHPVNRIAPAYLEALCQQPWKGNIRELRNVIERSLIVCEGDRLDVDDLPLEIQNSHYEKSDEGMPGSFELSAMERRHIARVLEYTKGNKTEAARLLKIGLTTLYRKIEEYKL